MLYYFQKSKYIVFYNAATKFQILFLLIYRRYYMTLENEYSSKLNTLILHTSWEHILFGDSRLIIYQCGGH